MDRLNDLYDMMSSQDYIIYGGNRDGREEGIKIASRQGIRDAEKARGNRTYYDANGRPYKITANGREYVKQDKYFIIGEDIVICYWA